MFLYWRIQVSENPYSSIFHALIKSNHDTMLAAMNMFQNHPSVFVIKQRDIKTIFNFNNTNENEIHKNIKNLNVCKACVGSDIPTNIIKLNINLFSSSKSVI